MNCMKIGKQIEIETIKLKLTTDLVASAEEQLKEGADDLHFRLSHFRNRVAFKDREKYDQFFFGSESSNNQEATSNNSYDLVKHKRKKDFLVLHKKKDQWIKKIYHKIVLVTHPDKFVNFSVENIKKKYLSIYRKVVSAWNENKDDQVLLCAYEANIDVNNPKALNVLKIGNNKKNNRLTEIKKLLAYQWYHIPEKDKSKTLEIYLRQLGYDFTTKEVEKVVNLARKRKVGTRPKSLRNIKNVK
jgi:hypothetical protein